VNLIARLPLENCPALVLNADYRPLNYYPLSLWSWQNAVKAVFLDRVNTVCQYERLISSPSVSFQLPSVVSLKSYVKPPTHPAFTRFNVFLRDGFSCQYCGSKDELTFDHLIPRSQGGRTQCCHRVFHMQFAQRRQDARCCQNVAAAASAPADGA